MAHRRRSNAKYLRQVVAGAERAFTIHLTQVMRPIDDLFMLRGRLWGGLIVSLLLLCLGATSAPAASSQGRAKRSDSDEAAYARELAAIDPQLADAFRDATAALDAGRVPEARKDFEAIVARAPEHAASLRRLSYCLHQLGEIDPSIDVARRARAAAPGPFGDYALASALMAKKDDPQAREEAGVLGEKLLQGSPDEELAAMAAQIAMERSNLAELGRAVDVLERVAPNGLAAGWMGAIYHASQGDFEAADASLAKAVAAGLPPEAAADFREKSGLSRHATFGRVARGAGVGFAAWLLGFAVIFVVGSVMSRRALAAVERLAPDRSNALVQDTLGLRRAYAAAIAFAAAYYYLSIPIVIAVTLGLVGLVVWGMLAVGWISVKLLVVVVLVGLASVGALARSLFVRRRAEANPGPRLEESAAPDLWAVLREVAEQVQTRPVDDVYVTPGTEIGVFERGTMSERLRDRGRRFLVLGVGALDGLTERQLRAILAHEYGHFAHRDTARGDLASTVRASLFSAVIRMANGGGASLVNPAWHFLRFFCALFERIALGASRLQEALADRFAAASYGGPALAAGLRHTVRRSVEFDAGTAAMISRAQGTRRAVANLYNAPPDGSVNAVDVETAFAKAMNNPGSPYDSHPPVAKRIAWLEAFGDAQVSSAAPTSDGPAWDLFPNRDVLEGRMTAIVNGRLEAAGHIDAEVPAALASPLDAARSG
jgi:Zn-dependent protease with chaperone function